MKFSINNPNVTKTNFSFIFLPLKNDAILSHGELLLSFQNRPESRVIAGFPILTLVIEMLKNK